ncbi:hypothetical protein H7170_00470 [Candidatus Gracilibacteria bacterium]|nr:hypothetical protein [Candidatus Gracilibacteria bacterium]
MPDISKNDPKLAALLSRIYLEKNPNGTINASKAIEKMVITNLNEIPGKFKDIADAMRKDAKELFRIAKEVAKSTPIKSLSDLKIVGIGTGEILNRSFHSFNQDEIKKYTPIIQEHLKGIQDPKQIGDIKKILTILLALNTGFEKTRLAADAKLKSETTKKAIEKNPNITKEKLGESLDSSGEQEKAQFAQEISVSRASSDNKLDTIKEYGIDTLEKAQQKLQELEKKGNLSEEEKILKSELSGYIQSKIREAQVYKDYSSHLTESDKKEIFTQTNQFISGNPKETYNFQALEKIAVLTDPESTPTQRTLAQLEAGQSVSMDDLLRGNSEVSVSSAPELSQVTVSKNSDGTFNIPLFAARNITKDQVNEYKEDTRLYAKLGLSQLIPHIPLLTQELRNKGVNTAIDGKTGTMEQQQILKSLYAQLFGKEIISSSLAEVERAFSSALGNPTNMKNAMQGVLSTHHLITDSGQSIAPDTLQNWMRKNTQDNQKPTINLT